MKEGKHTIARKKGFCNFVGIIAICVAYSGIVLRSPIAIIVGNVVCMIAVTVRRKYLSE